MFHWRHDGHHSVSNHQPHDCLLNRLFRRRSKKISKLSVTGLCAGKSSETGEFPAQMASNAENVSIWWRHHVRWIYLLWNWNVTGYCDSLSTTKIQSPFLVVNSITVAGLAWWRHQMKTFSSLLTFCAGNSPVPGEFPSQMPVTQSFGVFFDLRLNIRLSKQSWGWRFETLSCPLWRHNNGDSMSQGVCSHANELLLQGYYDLSTKTKNYFKNSIMTVRFPVYSEVTLVLGDSFKFCRLVSEANVNSRLKLFGNVTSFVTSIVSADGLAPLSARASAGTMIVTCVSRLYTGA